MIFSLRRPDVLPVGDLGVQKGLLRWVLAAHSALPRAKTKANDTTRKKYGLGVNAKGAGELDTRVLTPPPEDEITIPQTPHMGTLVTANAPPTPVTPSNTAAQAVEIPADALPQEIGDRLLDPPIGTDFDPHHCAPLPEGLTLETLKSRLAGKKAK